MRPLLVLLLVAAAVVAFFVAMNLGGDSTDAPAVVSGPDGAPAPAPAAASDEGLAALPEETREIVPPADLAAPNRTDAVSTEARRGNSIRGRVVLEDGTGVRGARVTLTKYSPFDFLGGPVEGGIQRSQTSSRSGEFTFLDLDPYESYTLIATHPDHGRREETHVQVADGEDKDAVMIVLRPGARLLGSVTDTGGNPIGDARVLLGLAALGTTADEVNTIGTGTKGDGTYLFPNVAEGNYTLEVEADGYGRVLVQQVSIAGKADHTQDVQLEVAHMIGGRVTDLAGIPLSGAVVQAWSSGGRERQTRSNTTTDEQGEFLIDDVGAGSYTLFVSADGYKTERVMRVDTGDMSVSQQLTPLPRVRGQVIDHMGQPLKSFSVNLRIPVRNTENTIALGDSVTEVRGSSTGEFEISCPNKGEYVVEIRKDPYAPTLSDSFTISHGGEVTGLVIRMTMGGSIRGRLVDAEGNPVVGARIQTHDTEYVDDPFFQALGSYPSQATEKTVESDAEGRFEITGLIPHTYQIDVRHRDHSKLVHLDIEAREGQSTDVGSLRLLSGAVVSGTVIGPSGSSLAGAIVSLRSEGQDEVHTYTARTDVDGLYTVAHVRAGSYNIFAQRPTDPNNPFLGATDQKQTQRRVSVSEGQTYTEDFTIAN